MLKKYVTLILFVLFVLMSSNAVAHPCNGRPHSHSGGPPGCPPNPPGLPIDGGIGVLLVIGIGYAVSKIKDKN